MRTDLPAGPAPVAPAPRRRSRAAVLGVADQLVSSATNYLTALVASVVLVPDAFGSFVVAYAMVTVVSAATRAVVGEPVLAHLPTVAGGCRRALAGSALGLALVIGLASGITALAAGLLLGGAVPAALAALAPWVPAVLVTDAVRFVLIARGRTGRALAVDLVWAGVQALALGVVVATTTVTVPLLAATWGLGALAGLGAALGLAPERPARPTAWVRASRHLSGWFTLTAVLGQSQIYLVLVLAGLVLSRDDTAGLRAVQLLAFQPPATLLAAALTLATPVMARHVAAGDPAGLRRVRRVALGATGAVGLAVLALVPVRQPLLDAVFPQYAGFAALVLPVALQTALLAVGVPFIAQLRGEQRGSTLFGVQLAATAATLVGTAVGLVAGSVLALAWGMTVAAGVALVLWVAAAGRGRVAPAPEVAT